MKLFFRLFVAIIFSFNFLVSVSAQEENKLGITMVDAVAPNKIDIYFTEAIEPESLRVTVENQTTKNFLNVVNYESSTEVDWLNHIYLDSDLSESTAYKLTVNSVISKNGSTITEGIDAIRDFVTPARFLNDSVDVLNAPDNKTAIVVETNESTVTPEVETTTSTENTTIDSDIVTENATKENKPANTDNLPATGMETGIYIIAILAILTIIMFSSRKRA